MKCLPAVSTLLLSVPLLLLPGNGSIEFPEFLILIANKLRTEDMHEEIREAFRVFDRNNDGHLSCQELRDILVTMGDKMKDEDINELMAAADVNGDGTIDYEGMTSFTSVSLVTCYGSNISN